MRLTSALLKRFKYGVGDITKAYANLPESYIKRVTEEVEWRTPRGYPQYLPREIVHKKEHFDVHRPWTSNFQQDNEPGIKHNKIFVEPMGEWSFFKGDRVEILVGPDKGKQGVISMVIQERNWVLVEGLNTKWKTMGKTKKYPGTVVVVEQPLLIKREVSLVDPNDLTPTEIEWRFTEDGEKVRVSPRTGRIIPIPQQAFETYDYKSKKIYKESPKDTTSDSICKITFEAKLKTFEMDVMDSMGITEDRIPGKTFWY